MAYIDDKHLDVPLNQIFYGPPGTGKTFHAIDAALEILAPASLDLPRKERKSRFDALVSTNHIRFVTFHQSFSYEDFVEGLKGVTDEKGNLTFEPVDGVFKSICRDAESHVVLEEPTVLNLERPGLKVWKMALGSALEQHVYAECMADGKILLGWGSGLDFSECDSREAIISKYKENGQVLVPSDAAVKAVFAFRLKMSKDDIVVVSDGNSDFRAIGIVESDYQFVDRSEQDDEFTQCRKVRWLKEFKPSAPCSRIMSKGFSQQALYQLHSPVLDLKKLEALIAASEAVTAKSEFDKYVLIIDEINRGNVSRIFGDLITLLEPSKRAGGNDNESIEVVLPYSKDRFSVPKGLYIIGTMNTSDRSLAGIDIALRRRFVFKEMQPKPEELRGIEIFGIDLPAMLTIMNQRIEALLNRDHCIGHAYFIDLANVPLELRLAKLGSIFENQIIPLLKEYFFEDWERIAWILNDHRKRSIDRFLVPVELDTVGLFGDAVEGKISTEQWEVNEDAFLRVEAYLGIVDHTATAKVDRFEDEIRDEVKWKDAYIRAYNSGSIRVIRNNAEMTKTMAQLRPIAAELDLETKYSTGTKLNTQQMGQRIIRAIKDRS